MSTLSGTSTVAEIEASFKDNASYLEDDSPTKCRAFITAGNMLLVSLPSNTVKGENSLSFNVEEIGSLVHRAENWLMAHPTAMATYLGPRATRVDFRRRS